MSYPLCAVVLHRAAPILLFWSPLLSLLATPLPSALIGSHLIRAYSCLLDPEKGCSALPPLSLLTGFD